MKQAFFPEIDSSSYAVLLAEFNTGIVLTCEGRRATSDEERYFVFSSLKAAEDFARSSVQEHPSWECVIYDSLANPIVSFRPIFSGAPSAGKERRGIWHAIAKWLSRGRASP